MPQQQRVLDGPSWNPGTQAVTVCDARYHNSRGWLQTQVGVGLGVSLRYVRQFGDKASGRVVAKAGLAGLELELGASRRVSEFSTVGMGVAVGTQARAGKHSVRIVIGVGLRTEKYSQDQGFWIASAYRESRSVLRFWYKGGVRRGFCVTDERDGG